MASMGSRRVGLEISNSAVRIAEIATSGGRPKLINLGQVRLPPRSVLDGAVVDVAAVASAIERCMKEGGFSAKEVHVGISGLRAITRELDMPRVPDAELDAAVRLQALDVIPFPVDKTLLSARPLEDVIAPDGTPMRRVLLAAAHRELVDPLLEAVDATGLIALSVDLTSTALVRSLYDSATSLGGPEAIVSVGAGLTTIVVHEAGVPHFVRTIAEGGDTITAAIAGALDLPIDDAESTKRNLEQTGPHIRAAATAAQEASLSLIGEIRSSIEYYSSLPGRLEVGRVTLTGGGSRLYGFVERVQQQLRPEVVLGSSLSRIDCSGLNLGPDDILRRDPLVSVVIGLGLPDPAGTKPLDLLPPEIRRERRLHKVERAIMAGAAVVLLGLIGLGVVKYLSVQHAESQVATLNQSVAAARVELTKYNKVQQEFSLIKTEQATLGPVLRNEVNWPLAYSDLAKLTPAPGVVTSINGTATPPAGPSSNRPGAAPTSSVPVKPVDVAIASLNINVASTGGYTSSEGLQYFQQWQTAIEKSSKFGIVSSSGLTVSKGTVTFSAQLTVLGTIVSPRLNKYGVSAK